MTSASYPPVRWGVVSTARINDVVLESIKPSDCLSVVAVASRTRERAEQVAHKHGIDHAYGDYQALLADPAVEAVYISLPNSMHIEWSIRALEAGKHVLCEKPLARRSRDVDEAFRTAQAAGRILSEGFMYRHHPQTKRVIDLVEAGAIGQLGFIRGAFHWPVPDSTDVRELQPELDGGALLYTGCYCVNTARLLAGEPDSVFAAQKVATTGVDIAFYGTIRFPTGVVAQFDASLQFPYRQRLELVGTEGSIYLDGPWRVDWGGGTIEVRRRGERHHPGPVEWISIPHADSYRLEFENLSDGIRGKGEPLLGHTDAAGQSRTLEALFISAREHRPVALSELK